MADQSLWHLENIDVSEMLCPIKLAEPATKSHLEKSFKKGDTIYVPEELAKHIFFVMEGRVKIGTYNEAGKEITKAVLNKGELFGELVLTGQEVRRDFARALEDCTICIIPADNMKALMRDHGTLSLFIMRIMGNRMLTMEKRLESLVFKDSRTRVVEFLYDLATEKGQRVGYEMLVRRFLTHQEIANMTATSRQTVTTILNDLRNRNVLTFNRRRMLVRDMELLKAEIHA